MAPDFDTLRRMWRCYSLRIASFYKLAYQPPTDMPGLWKKMERTHSRISYPGKPSFPSMRTPEEAERYIDACARAFLHYKDKEVVSEKKQQNKTTGNSWLFSSSSSIVVICFVVCVLWRKKKQTVSLVLLFVFMFLMLGMMVVKRQKPIQKKILLYKDTPDQEIPYIEDHLPPPFKITDNADACDLILSTKFVWGVTGLEPHQTFLTEYGKQPKKVVVFWITDSNDVFEVPPNVYFFRTSLYRRWRNPTEDILPFVFEPFETTTKEFHVLDRTPKPIIGFCGAVWTNRKPTLDQFRNDDRFQTLYIEHGHFAAGTREMYMENIMDTHFTICDRGNGNFTMRFWHVLSLGRIPILVEEDMVWPFVHEIEWEHICVRAQDPLDLVEKTMVFYHTHNIEHVQKQCLRVYHLYFTQERYLDKVLSTIVEK